MVKGKGNTPLTARKEEKYGSYKNKITVSFTKAEKEIIENFMSLTEQFSNICDKEDFQMFCRDCPFETFCNTYYNNADDVENFINRQINE